MTRKVCVGRDPGPRESGLRRRRWSRCGVRPSSLATRSPSRKRFGCEGVSSSSGSSPRIPGGVVSCFLASAIERSCEGPQVSGAAGGVGPLGIHLMSPLQSVLLRPQILRRLLAVDLVVV